MSDDVRAVVAKVGMEAWGQEFSGDFGEPALRWDDIDEADQMSHRVVADAILAALAEAGKVVVDRERFERVMLVAQNARDHFRSMHGGQDTASDYRRRALEFDLGASIKALKVDDLDPLPERGE